MSACDASSRLGLVRGLLAEVDCHARVIAGDGFVAMTDPQGLIAGLLTGLLALAVAAQGWRMLAGEPGRIGAWTLSLARIGLVLVLVSQWPVYRTLVFDLAYRGPQEVGQILVDAWAAQAGFTGDAEILLQRAYTALQATPAPTEDTAPAAIAAQASAAQQSRVSATTLLLSTVGLQVGARLLLAVLLALGPLFLLAILFRSAWGLVEGWLRACAALALLLLFSQVMLPVELALLAPRLRQIAANAAEKLQDAGPNDAALVIVAIFALIAVLSAPAAALTVGAIRFRSSAPAQARARSFLGATSSASGPAVASPIVAPRGARSMAMVQGREGASPEIRILRQISRATSRERGERSPTPSAAGAGPAARRNANPRRAAGAKRRDL